MTTNKPEVVAWRWRKPVVDDRGETVGATAWELSDAPGFLPWWTNDPLIRLSDYESLQAAYERLRKHLQSLIDQTTPLVPEPGNPMWSRRIQLEEAIAERDSLRAEREKLRTCLAETVGVAVTMLYESHRQDTIKEFGVTELAMMVDCTKHLAGANAQVEKIYRKAWNMAQGCAGSYLEGVKP